jgi:hypothetical protein
VDVGSSSTNMERVTMQQIKFYVDVEKFMSHEREQYNCTLSVGVSKETAIRTKTLTVPCEHVDGENGAVKFAVSKFFPK